MNKSKLILSSALLFLICISFTNLSCSKPNGNSKDDEKVICRDSLEIEKYLIQYFNVHPNFANNTALLNKSAWEINDTLFHYAHKWFKEIPWELVEVYTWSGCKLVFENGDYRRKYVSYNNAHFRTSKKITNFPYYQPIDDIIGDAFITEIPDSIADKLIEKDFYYLGGLNSQSFTEDAFNEYGYGKPFEVQSFKPKLERDSLNKITMYLGLYSAFFERASLIPIKNLDEIY